MPPVADLPVTMARAVQWSMVPSASLRPTMPPTSLSPVTTPVNWQLMRVPWLMPTMPPVVVSLVSETDTTPRTLRDSMEPFSSTMPKRPAGEYSPDTVRSEMVCPLPLNCPLKDGMGAQNIPSRERSCCRTTVLPTDH